MSRIFSKEHRKKLSIARKKIVGWHHSEKSKRKSRLSNLGQKRSEETRKKMSGKNNSQWKGGVSSMRKRLWRTREYRLWRIAVFERDNYTCVWCGIKSGSGKTVILNADHIKRWVDYPELRFAIDNGRTLCLDCHRKTDTWGRKKNE